LDSLTTPVCDLHQMDLRTAATVVAVQAPRHAPEWSGWLAEIGFLPGERVQLLGRAVPGGDPLVVRVGDSTFALRVAEAACVQVQPMPGLSPQGATGEGGR
jgi:ferrous iron transport protein A